MVNIYGTILHQVPLTDPSSITITTYDSYDYPSKPHIQDFIKAISSKSSIVKFTIYTDLSTPKLITGIYAAATNDKVLNKHLKFLDVEGLSQEDNVWRKLLNVTEKYESSSASDSQHNNLKVCCYGAAKVIRLSFLIAKAALHELFPKTLAERKSLDAYQKSSEAGSNKLHLEINRSIKSATPSDNWHQEEIDDPDSFQWKEVLQQCLESIEVYGFDLNVSPVASQVVPLLNISNILNKANRHEDDVECEVLLGLALINARRFLQAAEILRRVSDYYVAKVLTVQDITKGHIQQISSIGSHGNKRDALSSASLLNHTTSLANIPGPLLKAAKIEIIISDAVVQHSMIALKVEALQRAVEYFLGQTSSITIKICPNYDVYTALLKITSPLSKLLTKCLEDKLEPLQIASLRTIEFMIDTLGSNVGSHLSHILKQVLLTYPDQPFSSIASGRGSRGPDLPKSSFSHPQKENNKEQEPFEPNEIAQKKMLYDDLQNEANFNNQNKNNNTRNQSNRKALLDAYNHMLENFMNMLPTMAPQALHAIFNELVIPHIFVHDLLPKLRNYFFRMAERIVTVCGGDLPLGVSFYTQLLTILLKEKQSNTIAHKLWEVLKTRAVANMDNRALNKFIDWLVDTLYRLAEADVTERTITQLEYILDLIGIICSREQQATESQSTGNAPMTKYRLPNRNLYIRDPLCLGSLLKPLVTWLDTVVNSQNGKLELFKNIWMALTNLILCLPSTIEVSISDIALPLLWKVHKYCETSTPTQNMLKSLVIILSSIKEANENIKAFLSEFIPVFVECIPHSTHDESFFVFDSLIRLAAPFLDEFTIQKCILALLDQFTMKGKAQKQSKESFIKFLVGQTGHLMQVGQSLFYSALKICLLENTEPFEYNDMHTTLYNTMNNTLGHAEARGRPTHRLDSKLFSKKHDCFQDKLQFAYEMLLYAQETNFQVLYWLVANGQLQLAIEKLVCSGNSKVRLRAMELLKTIMDLFISCKNLKVCQPKSDKNLKESDHLGDSALLGVSFIPEFEPQANQEEGKQNEYNTVKAVFCRFILPILKSVFEQYQDSKIQYYCLTLLERLFQHFLPGPNLKEEIERFSTLKKNEENRRVDLTEIETISPYNNFSVPYEDETYLHYRLNWILKLWGYIQPLTESTCPNLKAISLTMICLWAKPDLSVYLNQYQKKLKSYIFTMLMGLLTHKESDMRYWGLMILGSVCGMNYNFQDIEVNITESLGFFQKLSNTISLAIWEIVYDLQKDWSTTNKELATALIQLAAPKDSIYHFYRLKKEGYTLRYSNNIGNSQNIAPLEFTNRYNVSNYSQFSTGRELKNSIPFNEESSINFSHVLKTLNNTNFNQKFESPPTRKPANFLNATRANLPDFASSNIVDPGQQSSGFKSLEESFEEDELASLFWLEHAPPLVIKEALSLFRIDIKFSENYWIEKLKQAPYKQYDVLEGGEEVLDRFYLEADELESPTHKLSGPSEFPQVPSKQQQFEEDIDLDDLGIIEVEDEDWIDHFDIKETKTEAKPSNRLTSKGKIRPESHKRMSANSPGIYTTQKRIRHSQEGESDSELNQAKIRDYEAMQFPERHEMIEDSQTSNILIDKNALRPHNAIYRPLTPPLQSNYIKTLNEGGSALPEGGQSKGLPEKQMVQDNHYSQGNIPNSKVEEGKEFSSESKQKGSNLVNIEEEEGIHEIDNMSHQQGTFFDKMEPPFEFPLNAAARNNTLTVERGSEEKVKKSFQDQKLLASLSSLNQNNQKEPLRGNIEHEAKRKPLNRHPNLLNLQQNGEDLESEIMDQAEKFKAKTMLKYHPEIEENDEESSSKDHSQRSEVLRPREQFPSGEEVISNLDKEGEIVIEETMEDNENKVPADPCPSPEFQVNSQANKETKLNLNNNLKACVEEKKVGDEHYHAEHNENEQEDERKDDEDSDEEEEEEEELKEQDQDRRDMDGYFREEEEDEEYDEEEDLGGDTSEEHRMRQLLNEEREDEGDYEGRDEYDFDDPDKRLQIDTDLVLNKAAAGVESLARSQTTKNVPRTQAYFGDKSTTNTHSLIKVHSVKNLAQHLKDSKSYLIKNPPGGGTYSLRESRNHGQGMHQEELEKISKGRRKFRFTKGLSQLENIMENRRASSENKKSSERKKHGTKSGNGGHCMSYFGGSSSVSGSAILKSKGTSTELVKDIIKKATNVLRNEQKDLNKFLDKQEKLMEEGMPVVGEKRSISAEKAQAKYYNLPGISQKIQSCSKYTLKKGSKEKKKKSKGQILKGVKKGKDERMDYRTFFPRKTPGPLKNNSLYAKDELDIPEGNNNHTL